MGSPGRHADGSDRPIAPIQGNNRMAAPGPDAGATAQFFDYLVAIASGVGGAFIGAFGAGKWFGGNKAVVTRLRTDLDAHIAADKAMFAQLQEVITKNADKQDARHEENLKAIGRLPDREDIRDLRDQLTGRLETIEGLARARAPN